MVRFHDPRAAAGAHRSQDVLRILFIGSRSLAGHPGVRKRVCEIIAEFRPDTGVSGDADGPDWESLALCRRFGVRTARFPVTQRGATWERDYKPRNIRMVDYTLEDPDHHCVAFLDKNSKTHGAFWTVRRYEKLSGKKAEVIYLDPIEEEPQP